jgi:hypothetical protein
MSTEKYHNCEEIIARTKVFLNVHTGKDLAVALGVSENAISTWKKRGTLDMGKILLACEGINQEWLLTGEGEATQSINKDETEENMYRFKYEQKCEEVIALQKIIIDLTQKKATTVKKKLG